MAVDEVDLVVVVDVATSVDVAEAGIKDGHQSYTPTTSGVHGIEKKNTQHGGSTFAKTKLFNPPNVTNNPNAIVQEMASICESE